MLNDVRRQLVEQLDAVRLEVRRAKVEAALADAGEATSGQQQEWTGRVLKMRLDQPLPDDACEYDELILAIGHRTGKETEAALMEIASALRALAEDAGDPVPTIRLALPVFTFERDTNALRSTVKHMVKAGITAWEAADLAGLRMLTQLGLADITADWTLYTFNRQSLAQLAELGATRCVTSPENTPENLQWLANQQGTLPIEFLLQQNTPLFISLTRPDTEDPSLLTGLKGDQFMSYEVDGLWITSRTETRRFRLPGNAASTRVDLTWDP